VDSKAECDQFNLLTPTVAMGTAIKYPVPDWVKPLSPERQSALMSKITNDGLTRSGMQTYGNSAWASKG